MVWEIQLMELALAEWTCTGLLIVMPLVVTLHHRPCNTYTNFMLTAQVLLNAILNEDLTMIVYLVTWAIQL
jgi:hypothetical protein